MCRWRKIRVSGGFLLLTAWFGLANGWGLLATVLWAAALHEMGHLAALRMLGAGITGFRLGLCGAVLETDSTGLSYGGELLAVLAGPAVNLVCALALGRLGWDTAAGAHLMLGAFNLLPVRPLDGGRALWLAAVWLLGPAAGEGICRLLGTVTALLLAGVLAAVMRASGGSLWLLPAVGSLLAAAFREMRGFFPEKAFVL